MNIAVLLTCYNRKDKTCSCLYNLFSALDFYNNKDSVESLSLELFLVDDGCTDGTASAVISEFYDKNIHIIPGTGSLFWAGGMRLAWQEACKQHKKWDFYLLLNDDTDMFQDTFVLLMQTHEYCIEHYGRCGIYSGATCAKSNRDICTYGGSIWTNKFKGISKMLFPSGIPQMCDKANANILLVSTDVVSKIGMLSKEYQHAYADYDYSIRARKKNIPVLLTSEFCGTCDRNNFDIQIEVNRICRMSLYERKQYFNHPLHNSKDHLHYIYNTSLLRYPIVLLGRMLNLYFPKLYYSLNHMRLH